MENITCQIRFLILNDENEVLKNFILTEREYDSREEACEAAQTVCCVLMNYCEWNIITDDTAVRGFFVKTTLITISEFHNTIEHIPPEEKDEGEEEENCSFDEIEDEDIDKFLAWMNARCQE